MRDFSRRSLLSFILKCFKLKQLRKPITATLTQNEELKALKPHQVEPSTVVQSSLPAK